MVIKWNGTIYEKFYDFDGGTYYTPKDANSCEDWVAIMDNGSVEYLFAGRHHKTNLKYEIIEED